MEKIPLILRTIILIATWLFNAYWSKLCVTDRYIKGVNRGSERLVIGANSTGWYTKNHYRTFIQIK